MEKIKDSIPLPIYITGRSAMATRKRAKDALIKRW
jgi:hypothetical protein